MPPALFVLVIFEIVSCFLSRTAQTTNLLFYASQHNWDDRHRLPCPAISVEMGSHELFCPDWPGSTVLLISACYIVGMIGPCYYVQVLVEMAEGGCLLIIFP
jgi:hypothetical protein